MNEIVRKDFSMKKLVCIALIFVLVLSMSLVSFADWCSPCKRNVRMQCGGYLSRETHILHIFGFLQACYYDRVHHKTNAKCEGCNNSYTSVDHTLDVEHNNGNCDWNHGYSAYQYCGVWY